MAHRPKQGVEATDSQEAAPYLLRYRAPRPAIDSLLAAAAGVGADALFVRVFFVSLLDLLALLACLFVWRDDRVVVMAVVVSVCYFDRAALVMPLSL